MWLLSDNTYKIFQQSLIFFFQYLSAKKKLPNLAWVVLSYICRNNSKDQTLFLVDSRWPTVVVGLSVYPTCEERPPKVAFTRHLHAGIPKMLEDVRRHSWPFKAYCHVQTSMTCLRIRQLVVLSSRLMCCQYLGTMQP